MARPSPTVRRRRLRAELRRLRTERGLTIDAVQELSKGDIRTPTLSRWETGDRNIRPVDVRLLLDIYGVAGEEHEALLALARQAKERGWWQSFGPSVPAWFQFYVGLESEASAIQQYSAELVPGLLQTAGYYQAFLGTAPGDPRITGREVEVRMARQERLASDDDPPDFWAVLNEAVIRRNVGGAAVMRAQLGHLADLSGLPNVTVQVLPFSAGVHPAMDGSFSILGLPLPADPPVVYLENQAGSVYLEESADVDRFSRMFSHLIAKALSPEESGRLLRRAAAGIDQE
jgi:transcriptional regulator with XRE-family HTH domain